MLTNTRRLAGESGTAAIGAKLDRQGWQTGNFAAFFAKARDEHVYEPASRQEMRVGELATKMERMIWPTASNRLTSH
jgi:hypothetical protein